MSQSSNVNFDQPAAIYPADKAVQAAWDQAMKQKPIRVKPVKRG